MQVALAPVPPPVLQDVWWLPCAVELVGFTPDVDAAAFASAPPCTDGVVAVEAVVVSFFSWPGASAALPLPFP